MIHRSSFDPHEEAINGQRPDPWKGIRDVDRASLFDGTTSVPDTSPSFITPTSDQRRLDMAHKALQESRQGIVDPIIIEPVMKRDREALRRPLPSNHS